LCPLVFNSTFECASKGRVRGSRKESEWCASRTDILLLSSEVRRAPIPTSQLRILSARLNIVLVIIHEGHRHHCRFELKLVLSKPTPRTGNSIATPLGQTEIKNMAGHTTLAVHSLALPPLLCLVDPQVNHNLSELAKLDELAFRENNVAQCVQCSATANLQREGG
jgi:hypothetical protein